MQTAGTTKRYEGKIAWIVAALHGDHANSPLHVCVRYSQNAGRSGDAIQLHAAGEAIDSRSSPLEIDRHSAAQQLRRADASQHNVRVGDRSLSSHSVAGWSRIRPRALRTHAQ